MPATLMEHYTCSRRVTRPGTAHVQHCEMTGWLLRHRRRKHLAACSLQKSEPLFSASTRGMAPACAMRYLPCSMPAEQHQERINS